MAGQRQPTNLVIAKGRKHFTKEEVERRLSREPRVSFTSIEAPEYLPKNLESKFYDYAYKLPDIGIMTELDEDCLANYLISHNLYLQYTNKISQAMRAGTLGRPLLIHGEYLQAFHAPPHDDGWRFDPALGGHMRAITEIGTHWVDLAMHWTGLPVEAVCAATGNFYPTRYRHGRRLTLEPGGQPVVTDTEDAAAVVLRFQGGAIGTVLLSEVSRGHGNDLALEVACERGSVAWRETEPDALLLASGEDGGMARQAFAPLPREDTFVPLFSAAYADMALPPARRAGGYPTFRDGAYLARVCEAIAESARTGRWSCFSF